MASDLSELIQNGLSSTLESLLAKTSKLEQTTKAHESDLQGQCVKVDSTFEFANITSNWSFFIPAYGASHIFNLMMGEDIEPSQEVDDDIVDALNEVVSNICGGLSTAINGSGFDDLGGVKFSLSGNEIVDGKEHSTTQNLFRFAISLEDREVIIFIAFDEVIMPYIETIKSSEVTEVEETKKEESKEEEQKEKTDKEETKEEESKEEEQKEETNKEETKEEESKEEEQKEETKEEESKEEEQKEETDKEETTKSKVSIKEKLKPLLNMLKVDDTLSPQEQKQAKLKKIIIIVGVLFAIVILAGATLFFTGAFEPEVIEKPIQKDTNTTKTTKKLIVKSKQRVKKINFKTSQINVKRLNKKLSLLTKYEILEEDAIEKIKAKEKERLYQEKRVRLERFAKRNKEESLFKKVDTNNKVIHKNEYSVSGIEVDSNLTNNQSKLKVTIDNFVQIPTFMLKKFQPFIKKAKKVGANLSICKSQNGRTLIFIGPFLDSNSRDKTLDSLNKKLVKNIKKVDLSQKQFNEKCNF